ncbi:F-box-like domain protein [Ceratobasidium sp. AG-Ba]|nr:F-box-like domain protein [Ceratobasidium sp. AG-Ba]
MLHVWRKLEGIHKLLLLIPGVEILSGSGLSPRSTRRIVIPEDVSSDLSRLSIYAPLVRSLQIFESEYQAYSIDSWANLAAYLPFLGRSFLPNLQRLIVNSSASLIGGMGWVGIFLSPSLVEIQLPTNSENSQAWIPESEASALLASVAVRCPSLQAITILSRSDEKRGGTGLRRSMAALSYEYVASMTSLRVLTIGKYIIQPESLKNIGLLPALETLAIHDLAGQAMLPVFDTRLPEHLFPSLRHLQLHRINAREIALLWRIDTLVKRLTHVDIKTVSPEQEYVYEPGRKGLGSWLPELFRNSPSIHHLSIACRPSFSYGLQALPTSSLLTIFNLPLQSLSFALNYTLDLDNFCRQLAKSCPGLRRLHIPYVSVNLSLLVEITGHFKHLEHLGANVSWTSELPQKGESGWLYSSGFLTCLEYHPAGLYYSSSEISTLDMAIYFLTIWPNLRHIRPTEGWSRSDTIPGKVSEIVSSVHEAVLCACAICARRTESLEYESAWSLFKKVSPETAHSYSYQFGGGFDLGAEVEFTQLTSEFLPEDLEHMFDIGSLHDWPGDTTLQ